MSPFAFRKKGLGKEGLVLGTNFAKSTELEYKQEAQAPFAP